MTWCFSFWSQLLNLTISRRSFQSISNILKLKLAKYGSNLIKTFQRVKCFISRSRVSKTTEKHRIIFGKLMFNISCMRQLPQKIAWILWKTIVTLPEKAKQIILKNFSYHILSLEITKLSRSYAGSYPSSFNAQ